MSSSPLLTPSRLPVCAQARVHTCAHARVKPSTRRHAALTGADWQQVLSPESHTHINDRCDLWTWGTFGLLEQQRCTGGQHEEHTCAPRSRWHRRTVAHSRHIFAWHGWLLSAQRWDQALKMYWWKQFRKTALIRLLGGGGHPSALSLPSSTTWNSILDRSGHFLTSKSSSEMADGCRVPPSLSGQSGNKENALIESSHAAGFGSSMNHKWTFYEALNILRYRNTRPLV